MGILVFIIILTFLVVIHELGHLLTAVLFKVHVEEFGVGFPPKVRTLFHWKGIPFTLNLFPIGGFVRMEGENGEADIEEKSKIQISNSKKIKTEPFYVKPAWQRLIIILAGATVNFIFGILAFTIIFINLGIPEKLAHPQISVVAENSPAMEAKFEVKDEILAVLDNTSEIQVEDAPAFISYVKEHMGKEIVVRVKRGNEEKEIPVKVRNADEIPAGEGALGVALDTEGFVHYPWYIMPVKAVVVGVKQSVDFGMLILRSLGTMVTDIFTKHAVPKDVSGPVGIAYDVQKQNLVSYGPLAMLNFAAILSVNLAIMNVLPIPALDGGRAFFILIEKFFEQKLRAKIENNINTIGFFLLMGLIGLITIKDVLRIFGH